jgi:ribose transport system substrate-binding protein
MIRRARCITILAAAVLLASGFSGFAAGSKGQLYYLQFDMINGFNIGSGIYMEKFAKEFGYDIKLLNAQGSSDTQINQMDTVISLKPKAIIVKPVDAATIVASVQKAKAAGLPVLSYDGTITDTTLDFHSVVGTVKMGEMAADECVKILKKKYGSEKGKVLQVIGDLGDMYTVLIDKGFKETIKKYPKITVITKDTPGWEQVVAANVVSDQLTANKDIDIIFVHADSRIPGIVPVLEGKGYTKGQVELIGTDGDPAALQMIRDGWIRETIGVPMVQQVKGVFVFIDKVIAKKKLGAGTYKVDGVTADLIYEKWGPTLYLPGFIITKQNVDDPQLWGNIKVE